MNVELSFPYEVMLCIDIRKPSVRASMPAIRSNPEAALGNSLVEVAHSAGKRMGIWG